MYAPTAHLRDQTKMADVIITLKIMPSSPEIDLKKVEEEALKKITSFAGKGETRTEEEPIAFGLKALKITFVSDEAKGSPDNMIEEIATLDSVASCNVIHVTRALG
jgi:elongation factor 1-beta